jgi:hypothetical protein
MGGVKTRPKWVSIMRGFWYILALPAQSDGAKFCKVFVVIEAASFVLEIFLPGRGVSYLSRAYFTDVVGSLAYILPWYVALAFVRERDEAQAEAKRTSLT